MRCHAALASVRGRVDSSACSPSPMNLASETLLAWWVQTATTNSSRVPEFVPESAETDAHPSLNVIGRNLCTELEAQWLASM